MPYPSVRPRPVPLRLRTAAVTQDGSPPLPRWSSLRGRATPRRDRTTPPGRDTRDAIDHARTAEINRQNAQKSTGPNTDAGKMASRQNAHQARPHRHHHRPRRRPRRAHRRLQACLDTWVADTKPQNVLEMAMISRGCRASWKLDRCARYEDAAASVRMSVPESVPGLMNRHQEADHLGRVLMFALNCREKDGGDPDGFDEIPTEPDFLDDPPGTVDALARFKEGVEWLLNTWAAILSRTSPPTATRPRLGPTSSSCGPAAAPSACSASRPAPCPCPALSPGGRGGDQAP